MPVQHRRAYPERVIVNYICKYVYLVDIHNSTSHAAMSFSNFVSKRKAIKCTSNPFPLKVFVISYPVLVVLQLAQALGSHFYLSLSLPLCLNELTIMQLGSEQGQTGEPGSRCERDI